MSTYLAPLQQWLDTLPPKFYINFKPDSGEVCKIPHAYVLHMVYYTSIIFVSKAYCQRACMPDLYNTCPHPTPCSEVRARLLLQSHEAARHISLLGDMYRGVFGSFRRSPLNTVHCSLTAAQVLLCVHRTVGGATGELPRYFKSCLDTLEELSESWHTARRFHHSLAEAALGAKLTQPQHTSHQHVEPADNELEEAPFAGVGVPGNPLHHFGPPTDVDFTDSGYSNFDLGQLEASSDILPWDYVNFDMPTLGYPFSAAIRDQFLQQDLGADLQ
jgi:hypothetical protein